MRLPLFPCVVLLSLAGCSSSPPAPPKPGAETVRVSTSHPGGSFVELGPVTGIDGRGCGDDGIRGKHEGAVSDLMSNAFAMGGTHVQVIALYEPRQMGKCFVNVYRVSGTAYRDASAAAPGRTGSGDVVQSLRELQTMRAQGAITQQEFDKLKAKLIQ
jgi:hypothetical protein